MARKTQTSYEVRKRWQDKAYKKYQLNLRHDIDQHLIDYIEANKEKFGVTNIVRDALNMYVDSEKK